MALKGRSTRRTLRIFTTDIAPELKRKTWRLKRKIDNLDDLFGGDAFNSYVENFGAHDILN